MLAEQESSSIVTRNLASKIDQVGFILTEFHGFGEVNWNFTTWGVNHETY